MKMSTVLDAMEIRTSQIQIYRLATPTHGGPETRYTILEPVEFVAHISRNISRPSEMYPNVDISLDIDTIKVREKEEMPVVKGVISEAYRISPG